MAVFSHNLARTSSCLVALSLIGHFIIVSPHVECSQGQPEPSIHQYSLESVRGRAGVKTRCLVAGCRPACTPALCHQC